ncbi:MAG: hypothetical protein KDB14_21775 [Planctomycetales bacterium]|nr:hypothetical protein [Planctomycetales bacterium]
MSTSIGVRTRPTFGSPVKSGPLLSAALLSLSAILIAAPLLADTSVRFDAGQTVACHNITTPEFAADHPGEQLWEAKLEVSSLISGNERVLQHYFYQVDMIDQEIKFVDYLPQTTLESPYADPVNVERKDERSRSAGISVTWDTLVKVAPTANAGTKSSTQVRYNLLPPKEQVAASGTLRRSRGVYFKLRPSTQHTLEGGKEFALVFRTPAGWRAGAMLLRCEAKSTKKSFFKNETVSAGSGLFMLALYQAGDAEAKAAALRYAEAESKLRESAHRERSVIAKQQASVHFPLSEPQPPRVPAGWLERLLITPGDANWSQYAGHLPREVKHSGELFLSAKSELYDLQRRVQ